MQIYDQIGFFDNSYKISGDYHSILKIFSGTNGRIVYIPKVFTKMRTGGASNRSLKNVVLKTLEDRRALSATGVGGLGTLALKNIRKLPQIMFPGRHRI